MASNARPLASSLMGSLLQRSSCPQRLHCCNNIDTYSSSPPRQKRRLNIQRSLRSCGRRQLRSSRAQFWAAPPCSTSHQKSQGSPHQSSQQSDSPSSSSNRKSKRAPEISSSASGQSDDPAHSQTLQKLLRYPTLFDPIRKPRHPLVLAHGLFGFDTFGLPYLPRFQLAYWHDVLKILRDVIGAEVIVTNVPGAGAVKTRAEALHRYLNEYAQSRAVNILAHSMGGLDARWLLTHLNPTAYTPLSLTTLSTPHRGSDFMSWCGANIGVGAERLLTTDPGAPKKMFRLPYSLSEPLLSASAATKANDSASRAAAAQKREWSSLLTGLGPAFSSYLLKLLDSPAYSNLTPEFLEHFNEQTPDRDDVRYYSVSARVTRLGVWHPLWLPKLIMDAADEKRAQEHGGRRSLGNDCLVSVESALWGEHLGIVDNCDHWDLRGSAGLRTSAADAFHHAVSEKDLQEREKHREKLHRVYQSISEFRDASAPDPMTDPPQGSTTAAATASTVARWITERIPFVDGGGGGGRGEATTGQVHTDPPKPLGKGHKDAALSFTTSKTPKPGTYTLEALYIALARKLYDDGF